MLGVLARVGGQLALGAYPEPDVFEYEEIASNPLAGHGYTYTCLTAASMSPVGPVRCM